MKNDMKVSFEFAWQDHCRSHRSRLFAVPQALSLGSRTTECTWLAAGRQLSHDQEPSSTILLHKKSAFAVEEAKS